MAELDKICHNVVISDNNIKVKLIRGALDKHGVEYNELGPGTNRFAVHIDGYAFKIAMDSDGKLDNSNEFAMSKELQPYVIKVYENNDLISVSEYVTLISREEFLDRREEILDVLASLGESYLLGDVGYVEKNFTNWGYRDNGDVVILDFAYIHYIEGHEILCRKDGTMLEYTDNYSGMRCPICGKKYTFSSIRLKIPLEKEWEYINHRKTEAHKLVDEKIFISKNDKGESKVEKYYAEKERKEQAMSREEENNVVEPNFGETFESDFSNLLAAKRRREQEKFQDNKERSIEPRRPNNNKPPRHLDGKSKPAAQHKPQPSQKQVVKEPDVKIDVAVDVKNKSNAEVEVNVKSAEEIKQPMTFQEALTEKAPSVPQVADMQPIPEDKLEELAKRFTEKSDPEEASLLMQANTTFMATVKEDPQDEKKVILEDVQKETDLIIAVSKPNKPQPPVEREETPQEKYERMARENGFSED